MNKLKRQYKRKIWLLQRGDRMEIDVLRDDNGEFVLMSDGHDNDVKVYLPNELQNEK